MNLGRQNPKWFKLSGLRAALFGRRIGRFFAMRMSTSRRLQAEDHWLLRRHIFSC